MIAIAGTTPQSRCSDFPLRRAALRRHRSGCLVQLLVIYIILNRLTSGDLKRNFNSDMNPKIMSFHNGTTRFVVAIPCLNVALKIAHVHPLHAIKTLVWMVGIARKARKTNTPLTFIRVLKWTDEQSLSLRWQFRGIYCNLREYRFFRSSGNPLLWPTVFSFFGLVNIQPFAYHQPPETTDNKLWKFVLDVTEENAA